MDFDTLPDRSLIAECLRNDPVAWEVLLERYKRLIYSVTVRYRFEIDERHEIFQTVCIEILQSLPSLREVAMLRHWIVTITIRQCNDFLRKKYRDRALYSPDEIAGHDPITDTVQIYVASEREEWLRMAMKDLSERCRLLIERLFLQEEKSSYEDVARDLGISPDSVGSARQRCLERLRKLLDSTGETR
jgi:RNA polymerase sigma factor (sigma-70 family)